MNLAGPAAVKPDIRYLRDAATSWFFLCRFNTAIPLEPAVYDLLLTMPEGVKRNGKYGWTAAVGQWPPWRRHPAVRGPMRLGVDCRYAS